MAAKQLISEKLMAAGGRDVHLGCTNEKAIVHNLPGDGRCFFHGVVASCDIAAYLRNSSAERLVQVTAFLRTACKWAKELPESKRREIGTQLAASQDCTTFEEFLTILESAANGKRVHGGQGEAYIASQVLQRQIVIWEYDPLIKDCIILLSDGVIGSADNKNTPIHLLYTKNKDSKTPEDGAHYDLVYSVKPIDLSNLTQFKTSRSPVTSIIATPVPAPVDQQQHTQKGYECALATE
jgi:hypothetical protein